MNERLARFNSLAPAAAEEELYRCFASRRWARHIAAARPYETLAQLMGAAQSAWADLDEMEWLAAFAAHPRIGERGGHDPAASEREQSGVMRATAQTLAELVAENREYERRFGYVFLIAARGRTGDDILHALRERMHNSPQTELRIAEQEQRKITRLRLEELVGP